MQLEKFDSVNAYQTAIDQVIRNASSNLYIFESNLADSGYNSLQRFQLLREFLLRGRNNRLVILLHETDYLTRYCPRLMSLLNQFSHSIEIKQTREEAKRIQDSFILADGRHYAHRFHTDHPRGQAGLDDPQGGLALMQRFREIEQASDYAVPSTTLGL